jgi:hypothetical protein
MGDRRRHRNRVGPVMTRQARDVHKPGHSYVGDQVGLTDVQKSSTRGISAPDQK